MGKRKPRIPSGYAGRQRSARPEDEFTGSVHGAQVQIHEGTERPVQQRLMSNKRQPPREQATSANRACARVLSSKRMQRPNVKVGKATATTIPMRNYGKCKENRANATQCISKINGGEASEISKKDKKESIAANNIATVKPTLPARDKIAATKKKILQRLNQSKLQKEEHNTCITESKRIHVPEVKQTSVKTNAKLRPVERKSDAMPHSKVESKDKIERHSITGTSHNSCQNDAAYAESTLTGNKDALCQDDKHRKMRRYEEIARTLQEFEREITLGGGNLKKEHCKTETRDKTFGKERENSVRQRESDNAEVKVYRQSSEPRVNTSNSMKNKYPCHAKYEPGTSYQRSLAPGNYSGKNSRSSTSSVASALEWNYLAKKNVNEATFATKRDLEKFGNQMTDSIVSKIQNAMKDSITGAMSKLDQGKHSTTVASNGAGKYDSGEMKCTKCGIERIEAQCNDQLFTALTTDTICGNNEEQVKDIVSDTRRERTPSFLNIPTDWSTTGSSPSSLVTDSTTFNISASTSYTELDVKISGKGKEKLRHKQQSVPKRRKGSFFSCCSSDTVVANAHIKRQDHRSNMPEIVHTPNDVRIEVLSGEKVGTNSEEVTEETDGLCAQSTAFFIPCGDYWCKQKAQLWEHVDPLLAENPLKGKSNEMDQGPGILDKREELETTKFLQNPNQGAIVNKGKLGPGLHQNHNDWNKTERNMSNKSTANKHNIPSVHGRQKLARKYGTVEHHQQVLKQDADRAQHVRTIGTKIDSWNVAVFNPTNSKRAHFVQDSNGLSGAKTHTHELEDHAVTYKTSLQNVKSKINPLLSKSTMGVLDKNLACIQNQNSLFKVASKFGARAKASTSAKERALPAEPAGYMPSWNNRGGKSIRKQDEKVMVRTKGYFSSDNRDGE